MGRIEWYVGRDPLILGVKNLLVGFYAGCVPMINIELAMHTYWLSKPDSQTRRRHGKAWAVRRPVKKSLGGWSILLVGNSSHFFHHVN